MNQSYHVYEQYAFSYEWKYVSWKKIKENRESIKICDEEETYDRVIRHIFDVIVLVQFDNDPLFGLYYNIFVQFTSYSNVNCEIRSITNNHSL